MAWRGTSARAYLLLGDEEDVSAGVDNERLRVGVPRLFVFARILGILQLERVVPLDERLGERERLP
jgi:hypothetical protein